MMKTREFEMSLAAADPVRQDLLDRIDLEAMEAELLADLDDEQPASSPPLAGAPRRRARRLALASAIVISVAVAAVVILAGGASRPASNAYGAELVRFAEGTPLLLLEGPGWRVQDLYDYMGREGTEGTMEFVTGKPVPDEPIRIATGGRSGVSELKMPPAAVRQRKVVLTWRSDELGVPKTAGRQIRLPVLDTTALVNTHAGRIVIRTKSGQRVIEPDKPGDRQMAAYWTEGGRVLELRAAVPDLAAFEERLDWLRKVDSQTWLDAMPATVVKAADRAAAVREMLKGIPLPSTFKASLIPDEGLTTGRSQIAGEVTSTVSCLWFRQWGDARRSGDRAAELEAKRALVSAPRWPAVRQGGSTETLLKLVKSLPSGVWQFGPHRWRLLPKAEGLGCARLGIPLLPRKIRRQREHGVPLPPP